MLGSKSLEAQIVDGKAKLEGNNKGFELLLIEDGARLRIEGTSMLRHRKQGESPFQGLMKSQHLQEDAALIVFFVTGPSRKPSLVIRLVDINPHICR